MERYRKKLLLLIFVLTALAIFVDLPPEWPIKIDLERNILGKEIKWHFEKAIFRPPLDLKIGPLKIKNDLETKLGLDLQGGTHLVLQAEMENIAEEDRKTALEATRNIVSRRVDLFGVSEPVIQTAKVGEDYRVIVELPGIKEVSTAIDLIGKTAQLDFREAMTATPTSILDFQKTGLTGADLRRSEVRFDPNTSKPQVGLEFKDSGREKFAEITRRNVGKTVAIFLDDFPVTIPRVNEAITDGSAVISGEFTLEQAKNLSIQLNAGALPAPIKIVEQKNIGATLGSESIKKSLHAGLIGLLLVVLFMWAYYGKLGLIADLALFIYGLLTLALYKLIPVVLTLPGIAGFILSVGMAVDANILIFERIKEELRIGKKWSVARELGFGRAWDSIKDANICTLIICFLLFNPFDWSFLNTSGMARGFALTLGLGVMMSLFTGIVVSRTLIRTFLTSKEKK